MAEQLTNYQCPACTAPLTFSPQTGRLDCEFCGSSYDIKEMEALQAEKEAKAAAQWDESTLTDDWGPEAAGMRAYNCPSCGAQLLCDQTTAATACPYCGNPTVVPGQFDGALKPDYVIPFKLSRKQAIEAMQKHYRGKPFLPKTFQETHTLEKIQGVYVPFWLYDGKASGEFCFDALRLRVYRQGDYEITERYLYDVIRSGSIAFEKVPVDGSSKMPDDYMDAIEPFDYSELKPFSTSYLPGFLADRYDVTVEACNSRADERCLNTLENTVRDSIIGFNQCTTRTRDTQLERGKVHYAMLPVWLLNVQWDGQTYLFAINGQTGRTVGKLPASRVRALAFFAKLAVPLSALGVLAANLIVRLGG